MTLKIGIVGCGWAAGEIARVAAAMPDVGIAVACDADAERASAFASRTGARTVEDMAAVFADPDVSLVYLGLPHALIAPAAGRALESGKHVLAEKPLALDPDEARRLGRMAAERGLALAVFFELRRAATVTAARDLIRAGEIGVPRLVRIDTIIDKRDDYWGAAAAPNWRARRQLAGGGVLLMNTIHQLDTLRYITGLEFTAAAGGVASFHGGIEVEDAASATLHLDNGGLVGLVAAAHSPGAGDEEIISIDGSTGRLDLPDPFGNAPLRLFRRATRQWSDIPIERNDSHALMLADVVRAARGEGEVPAGAEDAAAAVAAVNAIYRAAAEGRTIRL